MNQNSAPKCQVVQTIVWLRLLGLRARFSASIVETRPFLLRCLSPTPRFSNVRINCTRSIPNIGLSLKSKTATQSISAQLRMRCTQCFGWRRMEPTPILGTTAGSPSTSAHSSSPTKRAGCS